MMRQACKVTDCDRRIRRSGLCFAHLRRGEDATVSPRIATAARDSMGRKRCCSCEQWLELELFCRDSNSRDGRRATCLECHRDRRRFLKFGVSQDWFDKTLAAQGGCCAICQSPEPRGRGWQIDHDHACCPDKATSCGRCVRGILCTPCNLALGLFGDRRDVLAAARAYLEPERMSIVRGV
jgi:hypothetical protein